MNNFELTNQFYFTFISGPFLFLMFCMRADKVLVNNTFIL